MSLPKIIRGTYVNIAVEEPADSGTYVPLCGITTRSFNDQIQTRDRFIRDCALPESIPWRVPVMTGRAVDLSGSGLYNRSQGALMTSLMGDERKYRFAIGEPADDAVYTSAEQGAAVMVQRQITGNDDDDVTAELTFLSSGEWTTVTPLPA